VGLDNWALFPCVINRRIRSQDDQDIFSNDILKNLKVYKSAALIGDNCFG
jgi:hypothetical protein